jgi:hypothetical protein
MTHSGAIVQLAATCTSCSTASSWRWFSGSDIAKRAARTL